MAPEYLGASKISKESDGLYGTNRLLEVVDPKICAYFVKEEMECLMIVGLWCAHPDHNLWPSIRQAINVLNFEAPWPILLTKMPMATNVTPPLSIPLASFHIGTTLMELNGALVLVTGPLSN
ncbi:hypothetical protein ACSBR2_021916 [Camellia fascicularis]